MAEDLLEAWLRAWNNHDATALSALMTADGTFEVVASGRVLTQATVWRALMARRSLSSDFSIEYLSTQRERDRYAARWVFRGTHDGPLGLSGIPVSGRSIELRGVWVGSSEGDGIRVCEEYWDFLGLLAQVGVTMPPGVDWALAIVAPDDDGPEHD